jgi:hypothetical protein
MDNFAEQLVKRGENAGMRTKRILMIVAGTLAVLVLTAFSLLQLGKPLFAFAGLILAAAAGYGTYFLVQGTYVEYEYTFTNGSLDVDKIIAKKRRSSLLTVEVKQFTAFGKYTDDVPDSEDLTTVLASDNIASHEYYADFEDENYGSARLVFAPDEKMLSNVKRALSPKLRRELD